MDYPAIIKNRIARLLTNLSEDFGLSKLSKSPSRFNLAKLDWFNKEYLKMMTLEEFAWRSSDLKIKKSLKLRPKIDINDKDEKQEKSFRIGDYVFLVDLEQNKIFGYLSKSSNFADNFFYPVGGARESVLGSIQNLQKEVREELGGQIQIDETKLLKISTFRLEYEMADYSGVEFNLYFYQTSQSQIQNCVENENGTINKFQWLDLEEVITNGKIINYPIWQNFCLENGLSCFEPNFEIIQQYLALNLDKNRVSKLSEVG